MTSEENNRSPATTLYMTPEPSIEDYSVFTSAWPWSGAEVDGQHVSYGSSAAINAPHQSGTLTDSKRRSGRRNHWIVLLILFLSSAISFAFNGYLSILAIYLNKHLGYSEGWSTFLLNVTLSFNFICGLPAGALSDAYFGTFKTLLIGVGIFVLGSCSFVALELIGRYYVEPPAAVFIVALLMLSMGNGTMPPILSTMVGDQFPDPRDRDVRSRYFSWYYLSIQGGAVISTLSMPFIIEYLDPYIAFSIVTAIVCFGALTFIFGSRWYRKPPPAHQGVFLLVAKIVGYSAWCWMTKCGGKRKPHWLDHAADRYGAALVSDVKGILGTLTIFLPLPFFWAIYFQIFSLWVFMAEHTHRGVHVGAHIAFTIPSSEVVSMNAIFDLILIPATAKVLYPGLRRILGRPFTPLQRIGTGLATTVGAVGLAGGVQWVLASGGDVSVGWMVPQFVLISLSEILVSVTAYELAYTQAPENMRALLSSCWLLTLAAGPMIVSLFGLVHVKSTIMPYEYWGMAGGIVIVWLIYLPLAWRYKYREEEDVPIVQDHNASAHHSQAHIHSKESTDH